MWKLNLLNFVVLLISNLNYDVLATTTKAPNQPTHLDLLDVSISFANRGKYTDFIISTSFPNKRIDVNDAWVSVGINQKPEMNNTNAIVCRKNYTVTWVRSYLNGDGFSNLFDVNNAKIGLNNTKVEVINGYLICSFSRINSLPKLKGYYPANRSYYLLTAFGSGKLSN